jgi:S1-C subfamily serine protease
MRPILEQLMAQGVVVRPIDVLAQPQRAALARVTSVPTFVVIVDGKERGRVVGATTREELLEAIGAAEQSAGAAAPGGSRGPRLDLISNAPAGAQSQADARTFAQPEPGRIVPIDHRPPVARSGAVGGPSPRELPGVAAAPAMKSAAAADLIAATVRLSVEDHDGKSTGTGTIVDARGGKALVLTCGHIFRESAGKGPIQISLFTAGPGGAELSRTAEGALIDFDLDRDLALVCFFAEGPVSVAPIAPAGATPAVGDAATSVGCEHGADPTAWPTSITAIDRYQGHPNIEAAGAPVEGRSGGGLFNAAGQLIGVCNFAAPNGNEGLYRSLPSIYAKLDALKISYVYEAPSLGDAAALAAAPAALAPQGDASVQVRGQNPVASNPAVFPPFGGEAAPASSPAVAAAESAPRPPMPTAAAETPLAPQERAALEELNRRSAQSEVICSVRPRTPGGRSEVIKLDRASPEFVRALGGGAAALPTGG